MNLQDMFVLSNLVLFGSVLVRALVIVLIGLVVRRVASHLIDRIMTARIREAVADNRRARTLHVLMKSIIRYVIDFVVLLTVLQLLGINVSSLLAAAGIVGLAVGFGAQHVVRDLISGFFIVFEDQFAVGEFVTTAGVSGILEEIGLRTIKLRDFGGELHVIPNGKVEQATNHSRGNMRVLVQVDVAYEEDLDRVMDVMSSACEEVRNGNDTITDGPTVLGVQELGESGVSILVWARTKPMEQWAVGRELRLKLKQSFDREGIEIPYPRRVVVPASSTKIMPTGENQT